MNGSDGLPKGWGMAKIADIVELLNGYAFKPSDWQEQGLPIVRIQNLNDADAPFNHFSGSLRDRFRITDGDLLFAWSGTPGTSFGAHIWRGGDAWLNQHIFRVVFDRDLLDERFLRLAINHNLDDYIFQAHGGAGLAHITKGKFESSEILVAPFSEQRRIVAKIEELFSDLDAGVAALQRAKAKLKRYRAAVLKAAVEGRLTAEWRAANPPRPSGEGRGEGRETAAQLLQRILKQRRRQWEGKQLAKYTKAGKSPPKDWKEKYQEPKGLDESLLEVPDGWCWATVEQLLIDDSCNGISVKGSDSPPGIPALRLSAITDSGFDYSNRRYIPISDEVAESLAIQAGDFFVARGNGSLRLLGRGALAQPPPERIVFPDTMIRLRLADIVPLRSFLSNIWQSMFMRRQIERKARTTAGIYKISQRDIDQFYVPFPPIAEQKEIVSDVERAFSLIVEAEAQIAANLKRSSRLRQAVLKQAFEGKLVPQDPSDEPASVLLRTIQAERAAAARPTNARSKRPRKRRKEP